MNELDFNDVDTYMDSFRLNVLHQAVLVPQACIGNSIVSNNGVGQGQYLTSVAGVSQGFCVTVMRRRQIYRVQYRFQNITCQAGQAAPKVYLPRRHFNVPRHIVKQRRVTEAGLCPKTYLLSGASYGLVLLAQLPFFAKFNCSLQWGRWLCCTLDLPHL